MPLTKYNKKRDFKATPEPKGSLSRGRRKKLLFVVQQHHARANHYDFRLELDGVLKSWAVPKGPSLDPHEHHLAIQTEDHPFDYRKFEGVIPEGNYGAGNVIIWDQGWYEARKGDPGQSQKTLRAELKKGHLTFILHGKKLNGEFALIKLHGQDEKAWLLVKKGDEFASQKDITKQDRSIKSKLRVDDLGGKTNAANLAKYPKLPKLAHIKPMLATLVDEPFSKPDWLFEIKWDGYRAIASKNGTKVELYSRNDLDFSARYAPVVEALHALKHDVIFDGEIVVVDKDGRPHFEWLQNYGRDHEGELRYYIFDVIWVDGHDIRTMPLIDRKQLLKQLIPKSDLLYFSDHVEGDGLKLFKEMQKRGLEGMVAKRADSKYLEGVRGQDWLKVKTHLRQEVVIGGYTEPRGSRKYLGSLLVGVYDKGELKYVGHSGGGIADATRKDLQARLSKLESANSPFSSTPKPNSAVHWVKPALVAEMSFSEWTKEGYMRQPEFKGLREDKKPTSVKRERAVKFSKTALTPAARSGKVIAQDLPFEITHPDKVFFPKYKYTKGDLINYYKSVSKYMLPYLKSRPCSLNRMPSGIGSESFFQKNNEHLPDWAPYVDIFSESNNANLRWLVSDNLETLLYMVQLGCVEINPWNSSAGKLDKPDWIVIDLDPEGVGFEKVIEVAQMVKKVCEEWDIPTYPKTSGKSGLHIYIPMGAKYTYNQAKNLAHLIALEVNKRLPKLTSVERLPEKRPKKIYVDFLQNREGQTLAAPYSVRPTPSATVSMPLKWSEVKPGLKPTDFTIKNALQRLKRVGDLWQPVIGPGINLKKVLQKVKT